MNRSDISILAKNQNLVNNSAITRNKQSYLDCSTIPQHKLRGSTPAKFRKQIEQAIDNIGDGILFIVN